MAIPFLSSHSAFFVPLLACSFQRPILHQSLFPELLLFSLFLLYCFFFSLAESVAFYILHKSSLKSLTEMSTYTLMFPRFYGLVYLYTVFFFSLLGFLSLFFKIFHWEINEKQSLFFQLVFIYKIMKISWCR